METVLGFDAIAFWIVVTGALVGVSGGLLGSFLVLRRMSLMGDAISHAVLPGLALAFLFTQSRSPWAMLAGALVAGVVTAVLTQLIHRFARVPEDAAMGVVFTTLFALGVLIITRVASQVDLDPGCVLYGVLEAASLDTAVLPGGLEVPRVALTLGVTTAVIAVVVAVFWKELKIASFDPALATTVGLDAARIHYLLMILVAAFTVAAFEAVGSILVVAMLIVPAAAAYLVTDRLSRMVVIAAAIGAAASLVGRQTAWWLDTTVAPMMAVAAGGFFVLAVLAAPRYGLVARWVQRAQMAGKIFREDLIAMLYRWHEAFADRPMPGRDMFAALGGGVFPRLAWVHLRVAGLIATAPGGYALTEAGRQSGDRLIRGHRLWEVYLNTHFDLPPGLVHEAAHRMEHYLDDDLRTSVARDLDEPDRDPHGRPIP